MTVDLAWIVEHLPELIQLVLPGYIFIKCFLLLSAEKKGFVNPISVNTLLISQFLLVPYYFLQNMLGYERSDIDLLTVSIIAAMLGSIIGFILATQKIKEFSEQHFHVSLFSNPWISLPNRKKGIYADVHLKEENLCYRGAFLRFFEHDNETWIVLANHYLVDPTTKKRILPEIINITTGKFDSPPQIVINVKDVNRVEFAAVPANIISVPQ